MLHEDEAKEDDSEEKMNRMAQMMRQVTPAEGHHGMSGAE